jgi:catechol 2,3-dioxygenase-like lactoylglutathione lyase family enzyme
VSTEPAASGNGVNRIDHVAIMVRSIDQALPNFVDRLKMKLVSDDLVPAVGARLAFLDGGNTKLQLVEPTAPGWLLDQLEERGEGLHHVCFVVPDIEATVARLAPGADVPIMGGGDRARTAFLPATFAGLRVELMEGEPSPRPP